MMNAILSALARHASWLPEGLVRAVFTFVANVAWAFHIGGVRQLERNLAQVLMHRDGSVDRKTLRSTSRAAMTSYFIYFAEALTVGARSSQQLHARIRGEGDGLSSIQQQCTSSSAPIAMGHQGNWDYAGYWANDAIAPVTTVAERLQSEQLLHTFVSIRETLGMTILLTGQHGLTQQLEDCLMQEHVVVPLLADRDLSKHGIFVQAFGSIIRVARGPATIALQSGKPLYIVNMHRETLHGDRKRQAGVSTGHVCTVSGPVNPHDYDDMPTEQAVTAISQAWVDIWTKDIERFPEDWHMLQPIFIEDLDLQRLHGVPANFGVSPHPADTQSERM
ncbi:MAG: phosphatidylinositol mannoside acyltransferase [Bifidobacterium sp.]|nr:phosphatidylinositol mannoside acyltransferase [Bifidobacterium sp.]MCH4174335.1 phosphatidylinositol mannoside acyltransferase [Bifidobacterium sp.]